MLCALIRNSLVVGLIDLSDDDFQWGIAGRYEAVIDCTNLSPLPQIGWSFDGLHISGTSISLKITRLAMRQRFTTAELLGIMNYVSLNPASVVALLMGNLSVATFVDLSRPDTIAGIQYLTSIPLLTMQRATAILTTVPRLDEQYTPGSST